MCSLAVFCPLVTLLSVLFGVRALVEIKARPDRTGRRLALAAIIIGSLVTLLWLVGVWWWNANVRWQMLHGPQKALQAGLAGDLASFQAAFRKPSDDQQARAFLTAFADRYGQLLSCDLDPSRPSDEVTASRGMPRIPYVLRCARGEFPALARFIIVDNGQSPLILKWDWIRILDPQHDDLAYPDIPASSSGHPTSRNGTDDPSS
jgi:hypothetical protein